MRNMSCSNSTIFNKKFIAKNCIYAEKNACAYDCTDMLTAKPCTVQIQRLTEEAMAYYDNFDRSVEINKALNHCCVGNLEDIVVDRDAKVVMHVSERCTFLDRYSLSTFVEQAYLHSTHYLAIIRDVLARFESLIMVMKKKNYDFVKLSPKQIGIEVDAEDGKIEYLKLSRTYVQIAKDRKSQLPYKNFPGEPRNIDFAALAFFCYTGQDFFSCCKNVDELDSALENLMMPEPRRYIRMHLMGENDVPDEDSVMSECSSSEFKENHDAEQAMDEEPNDHNACKPTENQLPEAACQSSTENISPNAEWKYCDEWGNEISNEEIRFGKFKTLTAADMEFRLCEIPHLDIVGKLQLVLDLPTREFRYPQHDVVEVDWHTSYGNAFKYEGNQVTAISWGESTVPDVLDERSRKNLIMLAAAVEVATSKPCLILNDAFGYDGLTITVYYNKRTDIEYRQYKVTMENGSVLGKLTMEKEFAEKMHHAAVGIFEFMLNAGTLYKTSQKINFEVKTFLMS